MKSFLSILILLSSTLAFASRYPTAKELINYEEQIMKGSSVSSLLKDIKSGKINPIISMNHLTDTLYVVSGVSEMAHLVIAYRFDVRKPLGNEQENLELLSSIINTGVNLQYIRTPEFPGEIVTLMDEASTVCSPKVVDLLINKGADPSLQDFYWVKAYRNYYEAESDSSFEKNCLESANKLASKAKTLSRFAINQLFYPDIDEDHTNLGSFTEGARLDGNLSNQMKESLQSNLGITLSNRPDDNTEPTKVWFKEFLSVMSVAGGQDERDKGINWLNSLNDVEKAWACYYSSFDEALTAFHNLGYTDEVLVSKPVGGSYLFETFSKFNVYTFGPFCNSSK